MPLINLSTLQEEHTNEMLKSGGYSMWTNEASALFVSDESRTNAEIYEQLGYTKTVSELPIKITIQPEALAAAGHTAPDGQDTFDFPDYTLKVIRMDFGTASTMVELHLYPKFPLTRTMKTCAAATRESTAHTHFWAQMVRIPAAGKAAFTRTAKRQRTASLLLDWRLGPYHPAGASDPCALHTPR